MIRSKLLTAALTAFGCIGAAHALPVVYQGTLVSGVPASGSVGGTSWADEAASLVDFWRFSGVPGDTVSITVTRGSAALDPAFSLYFGTTNADGAFFLNDADWGGLVFLTFRDDDIQNPGPGGDPSLNTYLLPFAGNYTLAIGGFNSTTSGEYNYNLSYVAQPIPEPEISLLMAGGLCGLAWYGRRTRRAGRLKDERPDAGPARAT